MRKDIAQIACVECGKRRLMEDGPQTLRCEICGNRQHDTRGDDRHRIVPPADAIGAH